MQMAGLSRSSEKNSVWYQTILISSQSRWSRSFERMLLFCTIHFTGGQPIQIKKIVESERQLI